MPLLVANAVELSSVVETMNFAPTLPPLVVSVVPTATPLAVLVVVPLVVHCARASPDWSSTPARASRQNAAARARPRLFTLRLVPVFMSFLLSLFECALSFQESEEHPALASARRGRLLFYRDTQLSADARILAAAL